MKLAENILYGLSKSWPSPIKSLQAKLGTDPTSEEYLINYAYNQYDGKTKSGIGYDIRGKKILEIGCGHGGISIFMAVNGAKEVVGIDLNTMDLEIAKKAKRKIEAELGCNDLPVNFLEMNAYDMKLDLNSFDIVIADNVFEHFMEPEKVMQQSYKILKSGGLLIVPRFSSIWSKYSLHLKNGLKLPWANLFFSEQTICNVMVRIVEENSWMQEIYPGYKNNPKKVRDLRRYNDLNDITYAKFRKMAQRTGFEVTNFQIFGSPVLLAKVLRRIPIISNSVIGDIFSVAASSVLKKSK